MKTEEIQEIASRYIDAEDMVPVPEEGEVFCFFHRELPDNKVLEDDEGWEFGGYGQLIEYELDMLAKPVGKWITMHYTSLAMFPPRPAELRLQPPHIVLGKFTNPEKTVQTWVLCLRDDEEDDEIEAEPNVMQFPGRK